MTCGRCGRFIHDPDWRCYFCTSRGRVTKRGGTRGRKATIPAHTRPALDWPENVSAAALESAILRYARELARAQRKGRGAERRRLAGLIMQAGQALNDMER